MFEINTGEFDRGDFVRIVGEPGYFIWLGRLDDGTAHLYGGARDPHGRRQSRFTRRPVEIDERIRPEHLAAARRMRRDAA